MRNLLFDVTFVKLIKNAQQIASRMDSEKFKVSNSINKNIAENTSMPYFQKPI